MDKEYKNVIKCLLKSYQLGGNNFETWYYIGNSYLYLKDYSNAINYYEKGIEINSNDCDILNNYGVALAKINKIEEAKKYFNKALKINSKHKMAKYNIDNLNSLNIEGLCIEDSIANLLKTML